MTYLSSLLNNRTKGKNWSDDELICVLEQYKEVKSGFRYSFLWRFGFLAVFVNRNFRFSIQRYLEKNQILENQMTQDIIGWHPFSMRVLMEKAMFIQPRRSKTKSII